MKHPATPKPYHRAHLMSERGVSALCFGRPRVIDLSKACWTIRDEAVTCKKCKRVMERERRDKL
jgi:hypothetical protein